MISIKLSAVLVSLAVFSGAASATSMTATNKSLVKTIGALSSDGQFKFNGESWELAPHVKSLKNGQWIHVDNLSHGSAPNTDTPKAIGDISADGMFEFKGEGAGWEIRQHRFESRNGTIQHVDNLSHEKTTSPAPTKQEMRAITELSPGA